MPRIDLPNLYGNIEVAGDPGVAGQKLYSQGPGIDADWDDSNINLTWTNNTLQLDLDNSSDTVAMVLVSADADNLAISGTDGRVYVNGATVGNVFPFTSASSLSHVINHNLNNKYPTITVFDTSNDNMIVPATIVANSVNQITITFAEAKAIAGTVVG